MAKTDLYKDAAKEIYFDMLNAGRGMISEYCAKEMAKRCMIHISEAVRQEKKVPYTDAFWGIAISKLTKL